MARCTLTVYAYTHIIYKIRLVGAFVKYTTDSEVRRNLSLINPNPRGLSVANSNEQGHRLYIC